MITYVFAAMALQMVAAPNDKPPVEPEAPEATADTGEMSMRFTTDGKEDLEIDKHNAWPLISKRYTDTGSRITSRKVCKTAGEWEDQRNDNSDLMRTKRGAAGGPQPGNSG